MNLKARDRAVLRLLYDKNMKREELFSVLPDSQTCSVLALKGTLKKLKDYGLVRRVKKGYYSLTKEGRTLYESEISSSKILSIGQDLKLSNYITEKIPSQVYQAVVRLALSVVKAKQSEVFNHFKSGWPGLFLAGQTKTFKTPLGQIIGTIIGVKEEDLTRVLHLASKGELGGRRYQVEGGKWTFTPSPLFDLVFIILDELDKLLAKDASQTAKYLAHGDKNVQIEDKIVTVRCVPFITLNVPSKNTEETIRKIEESIGLEYLKRCVTVNVDALIPYLEDISVKARQAFRDIPKLNLKTFPVEKVSLTDEEFDFMYKLLKDATIPDKRGRFDERGVEILILGRHALSGNKDIVDATFQTVWDRLLCLETLDVTIPKWREPLKEKWSKYKGQIDPELEKIRLREEERDKEALEAYQEGKEKTRVKEEVKQDEEILFLTRYEHALKILKNRISVLKRLRFDTVAGALQTLRLRFKKGTKSEERLKRLTSLIYKVNGDIVKPAIKEYEAKQAEIRDGKTKKQTQKDIARERIRERRREIKEMRHSLWYDFGCNVGAKDSQGVTWRKRTENLRMTLYRITDVTSNYYQTNFPILERRYKALLGERQEQLDEPELTDKIMAGAVDFLSGLFGKGDGKRGEKKKPPKEPKSRGYGGRSIDEL